MVKTLQKKFIITAMIAITVLLVVTLGAVNVFNISRLRNEMNNTLTMLVENDGMRPGDNAGNPQLATVTDGMPEPPVTGGADQNQMELPVPETGATDNQPEPPEAKDDKRPNLFNPEISEDMAMAARYFLVRFDMDGKIVYTDVNNISSVDEETANAYASEVYASGKTSGKKEEFRYRVQSSKDGRGTNIVFLNVGSDRQSMLAVLLISSLIFVVGWGLMLLLVIALSKRAIRPIAENLEKQKQFVTDAGHEIKTPLAIILANTEAMELHNGESKWSKNIRKQTERLSGLMKNLLTLARMEEGTAPVVMTDLDMSKLTKEVADSFVESAKLKKIELQTKIASDIKLHANREEMTQLLTILLDNAIKYSIEQADIVLTLAKRGKEVMLSCENTCEKLPDVEADRLFDRFYRSDAARTQKSGGYGIGLSVARAIVQNHKGKISAEYKDGNRIVFKVEL
ncbi:sensor histidine kinase [Eubacterium sp. MSJ-33]|uniref:sensor histidine kinase n=1 Tax=Eubacterium sp. MSJ-33 TaxID=2841528 RepID=UPI001C77D96D|nr:HAMP domain-containing sensor histidine kinase [Eubacterium sp. MSJ-33]QWT51871.1 HAMP domain-containing histidine kinase [Eubacterium sp. MSJ-33]